MTRLDFGIVVSWWVGDLVLVELLLVFVFVFVEVAMRVWVGKYLLDYREYDERNQGERKSYVAYI